MPFNVNRLTCGVFAVFLHFSLFPILGALTESKVHELCSRLSRTRRALLQTSMLPIGSASDEISPLTISHTFVREFFVVAHGNWFSVLLISKRLPVRMLSMPCVSETE